MSLTVIVWKWNGWRPNLYTAAHVLTMKRMLDKHLTIPHRFVCVTDDAKGLDSIETMPIWDYPKIVTGARQPNCYRRLRVFSREARSMFGERVLSIDLDAVVLGNIDSLITDDDFKIMQGKAAPYNGSMFLHRTGTRLHVWDTLSKHTPDMVRRHERMSNVRHYGSDQAWMSFKLPGAPTWGAADGVHHFTLLTEGVPTSCRLLFCAGGAKPWSARVRDTAPEAYAAYQSALHEAIDGGTGITSNLACSEAVG